jgi:medium-chain acyl-[acyl-carrier-protein] hydrolase
MTRELRSFAAAGPIALFGHSMGGLISYEWAQRLRTEGIEVQHLFVSACRAPSQFRLPADPLHKMPDRNMIERLNGKYGTGAATSKGEMDLMMFMAPTIRADLKLLETYTHPEHAPLDCPLTILGGADDDQITRVLLQDWEQRTTGNFKLRIFPGHHFYIRSQDEAVTKFVKNRLGF